jgi:hypothetical protein
LWCTKNFEDFFLPQAERLPYFTNKCRFDLEEEVPGSSAVEGISHCACLEEG